jgi:hypothetical protein
MQLHFLTLRRSPHDVLYPFVADGMATREDGREVEVHVAQFTDRDWALDFAEWFTSQHEAELIVLPSVGVSEFTPTVAEVAAGAEPRPPLSVETAPPVGPGALPIGPAVAGSIVDAWRTEGGVLIHNRVPDLPCEPAETGDGKGER